MSRDQLMPVANLCRVAVHNFVNRLEICIVNVHKFDIDKMSIGFVFFRSASF